MIEQLDFNKHTEGLIPAIIQDFKTQKVLMLGYMNKEAVKKTVDSGRVCFFSRSKQRLWTKGEESGNFLEVESIKEDCDQDTILIQAHPLGPVCHKGTDTCWAEKNQSNFHFLNHLENVIKKRKNRSTEKSYVAELLKRPVKKVAQKVGEEAVETILEAETGAKKDYLNEHADLLFHQMVLLARTGYSLQDVIEVLEQRHQGK